MFAQTSHKKGENEGIDDLLPTSEKTKGLIETT